MSKISLDGISRDELLELQKQIKHELRQFRPYRIRERMTTCGNAECWCADGHYLHGPYLHVVYRDGGKTKSISLGPKLEIWEMVEAVPAYPDVTDYLSCPNHMYEELPVASVEGWFHLTLRAAEFKRKYGCTKEEDNFDRAEKFWGSGADYRRYSAEVELHSQYKQVPYNPWSGYGVGNLKAIAVLTTLESKGYYQKA